MPYVHIVIVLALAQFFYFSLEVGKARGRYNVPAPATTGNEMFERYFRVHMNTLELLVMFIPAVLLFGLYLSPYFAAGLGVIYLIGRLIYLFAYVKDPKKREVGFGLSIIPIMILILGALVGAARAAWFQ
ncbi:MAG: MAPEG family protein [Steroidobacteraceae bacterium]